MRHFFIFLFFIVSTFHLFGQDAKEVILKMQEVYQKYDNLEYNCVYDLYKGHQNQDAQSSYSGYVYKEKELVYQQIDKAEMIYGNDFFLKINQNEKAMILEQQQVYQSMNSDLDKSFEECRAIDLEDKGDFYLITMTLKSTSQIPYSLVKLAIDKKKYYLTQIDLYYSDAENFSEVANTNDMAQPHLKISFTDISFSPKKKSELFEMSKYLSKTNNELVLTPAYIDYELLDRRIK